MTHPAKRRILKKFAGTVRNIPYVEQIRCKRMVKRIEYSAEPRVGIYKGDKGAINNLECCVCGAPAETRFCFQPPCVAMQNFVNNESVLEFPLIVRFQDDLWLRKAAGLLHVCRLRPDAERALVGEMTSRLIAREKKS